MCQYYIAVNLDKKQYMSPHALDDGARLMELNNTARALAVLCAHGNGRGGGDCRSGHPCIGSWAGDRIVVAGDYGDDGAFGCPENVDLYRHARATFKDISSQIAQALREDEER